jgi:hypothetical protein
MKQFNVTAQIYNKLDKTKQTILMNEIIDASSKEKAIATFHDLVDDEYHIVKIYSIEETY